jgi:hypothetical protein
MNRIATLRQAKENGIEQLRGLLSSHENHKTAIKSGIRAVRAASIKAGIFGGKPKWSGSAGGDRLVGFEVSLKGARADTFPASGKDNQEYYSNLLAAPQRV